VQVPVAGQAEAVSFVQNYYSLLPGNTDTAFSMLSPAAQAQSGGRETYEAFYRDLQSVTVQNVRAEGGNTVAATVVFVRRGGQTTSEPYRFVIGPGDSGSMVMESFSKA
jgi:hypothetical protein